MRKPSCTEQEFIALWNKHGSVAEVAKILGITDRNVHARRRRIEEENGIILKGVAKNSPDFKVTYPENNVRVNVELQNGIIVVGSDCHYWPGIVSTAHRAFVKIIKDLKPKMVVMNGDVFDGASISRYPVSGWGSTPTVKQELEACQERLGEIEEAAKGASLNWTFPTLEVLNQHYGQ
jgi:DNA-binding Lrp family transcriptional regulator